jgi:hypothetical protein
MPRRSGSAAPAGLHPAAHAALPLYARRSIPMPKSAASPAFPQARWTRFLCRLPVIAAFPDFNGRTFQQPLCFVEGSQEPCRFYRYIVIYKYIDS